MKTQRYAAFLVLPEQDKFVGFVSAPSPLDALEEICVGSGGFSYAIAKDRAVTCDGDTFYVEASSR